MMLKSILFVIILISLNYGPVELSSNDYHSQSSTDLLLVQFIFRHGDRAPIRLYNNDPYKRTDFKEGLGGLTNRGKQRMYDLGRKLQEYYHEYLNLMPLKNVHARSSSRKRCMESCALLLAGMFPPRNNDEIWNDDDLIGSIWQPIAIDTVESHRDWLLFPEAECIKASNEEAEIDKLPEVKQFLAEHEQFIKRLEHYTGTNFSHWLEIGYLHDTLTVEKEYFGHKYLKADWIDQMGNDTMEKLEEFHQLEFSIYEKSEKYLRLRIGPLIKQVIDNMNQTLLEYKQNSNKLLNGNHIYLYSTHDTSMGHLFSAIGAAQIGQLSYGSGLIIELHYNHLMNEPYIRLYHLNGTDHFRINPLGNDLNNTKFQYNCNYNCSLRTFIQKLSPLIPGNIVEECLNDQKIGEKNKNCKI